MRKLIEISQDSLLQCDNKSCDYTMDNPSKDPFAEIKQFIDMPCPKCGQNLLTEKDYAKHAKMLKAIKWLNRYFSWITIFIPKKKKPTVGRYHVHTGVEVVQPEEFIQISRADKWVVIKITSEKETIYKLFATWFGGYLGSDAWRINSGIVKVETHGNFLRFFGHSGSCYECPNYENLYGTNNYTQGILESIIEKGVDRGYIVEVMPQNTDWSSLKLENK